MDFLVSLLVAVHCSRKVKGLKKDICRSRVSNIWCRSTTWPRKRCHVVWKYNELFSVFQETKSWRLRSPSLRLCPDLMQSCCLQSQVTRGVVEVDPWVPREKTRKQQLKIQSMLSLQNYKIELSPRLTEHLEKGKEGARVDRAYAPGWGVHLDECLFNSIAGAPAQGNECRSFVESRNLKAGLHMDYVLGYFSAGCGIVAFVSLSLNSILFFCWSDHRMNG